jgi:hypothetical protein
MTRHTEINSIINRSLTSIHVNSTLEPNGLSRDDGKRPDGMTLVPWIKGQPLVWDVTVVDTLAEYYVLYVQMRVSLKELTTIRQWIIQ